MGFQVTLLGAFLGGAEDPSIILQRLAPHPTQQVTHKPLRHQHKGLKTEQEPLPSLRLSR